MIRLVPPAGTTPLTHTPTRRDQLRAWAVESLHRLLNQLGVPGAIQPLAYRDELTNQQISVAVGLHYTILTVSGREYYFDRVTGKFDGTGVAL